MRRPGAEDDPWSAWAVAPPRTPAMRVLASGSSGNCTLLVLRPPATGFGSVDPRPGPACASLIDAGLSPRRTLGLLRASGVCLDDVGTIVLTHLDRDHVHAGWAERLERRRLRGSPPMRVLVHAIHERAARSILGPGARVEPFDDALDLLPGCSGGAILGPHDQTGVAVLRVRLPSGGELGFATDLGRATCEVTRHLRGVDVLGIESNYCERLQVESDRPDALKRRIMGGAGHLSNRQCAEAVQDIGPLRHVVLLHLSRECNTPDLAAREHNSAAYALTVTSQDEPSEWISLHAGEARARAAPEVLLSGRQLTLFCPSPGGAP